MSIRNMQKIMLASAMSMLLCGMATSAHADGKSTYIANKCNKCHEAPGVAKLPSEAEEGAEGAVPAKKAPTLNGALLSADFGGDVAKISAFLRLESTKGDGTKHKKKIALPDAQLAEVIGWLKSL